MQEITKFNKFIRDSMMWIDFEVNDYSFGQFKIIGSEDFSYEHVVELKFEDVHFLLIRDSWSSDPNNETGVISIIENDEREALVNLYGIEYEFNIYQISTEDYGNFIVCAKSLIVDYTRVFYYPKSPLLDNEKLADWVQTNNEEN
jgi:hypothetical protein